MSNSDKNRDDFIASLGEVTILVSSESFLGVPIPIVLAGILVCGYMMGFISFAFGSLLAIFYFGLMYYIHKDDPQAVQLWIRAFNALDGWRSSIPSKPKLIVIIEDK